MGIINIIVTIALVYLVIVLIQRLLGAGPGVTTTRRAWLPSPSGSPLLWDIVGLIFLLWLLNALFFHGGGYTYY